MAARTAPTGRQRRLAIELRRMREQAGVSIQEAAAMLGADRTMVSNIEAGRTGVSEERVRRLACHYECPDQALIDALASMASNRRARHWWDEYRGKLPDGFLDISEVEYYAVRLRTVQTAHLPGLFQTEDHARALFDLFVPALPRLEVELRVAHRLARRTVIEGDPAVPYTGVIHEAALRMQPAGRDIARAQLDYLLEEGERENVTFLVIPFSSGGFPLIGDSVLYAEASNPHLDTVHMDASSGPAFVDSPTQLANFRSRLDLIEQVALTSKQSRDFILTIAREL